MKVRHSNNKWLVAQFWTRAPWMRSTLNNSPRLMLKAGEIRN